MSINKESTNPVDALATVDTEGLELGLEALAEQLGDAIRFHELRQEDAINKTGNRLFQDTGQDNTEALEKLNDLKAEAIKTVEYIENSKGNSINSTSHHG